MTTKLQLKKGPEGAPNFCFGLYDEQGRCWAFVQTDWEYPSLANAFGWQVKRVRGKDPECEHDGTDGTVDCPGCVTTSEFLAHAYDFLAGKDGEWTEHHEYRNPEEER
jgi:hypothetical protein